MSKGPNPFERPDCAHDESIVEVTPDQRATALKHLADLYLAAKTVHEMVGRDELTVSMRYCCLGLIGSHLESVKLQLGAKSDEEQAAEHDANQLRQANGEIHRLREQLGTGVSLEAVGLALGGAKDRVYAWWKSIGFTYMEGDFVGYSRGGFLQAKFSVSIDRHGSLMDDQPVTNEQRRQASLEYLETQIEIVRPKGDDARVVDSIRNRQWIAGKILARFPGARITGWTSCDWVEEVAKLRQIEVLIPIEDTTEPVTAGGPSVEKDVQ